MRAERDFDVVVIGAGPVGASLAAALRGLRVALVAAEPASQRSAPAALDARVYAVSPGNVAFLRRLGAWQSIAQERVCPVHAMHVFGDDGSRIEFDAYRAGVAELAWIVEDSVLQAALSAAAAAERFAPAEAESIDFEASAARVRLRDGRVLQAALVAGADGAQSFVRAAARIGADEERYGQSAVVANFACEKPHRNAAWQWFQGGPVLALLPLPGDRFSLVWSLPESEAERVARLDAERLCAEVEAATRGALGRLALVTPPRSFPLRRLRSRRLTGPRAALLGDAAHVIHVLAGQGLNLGLQDARALADVLLAREPVRDPGDPALLRRYERRRAEPLLAMDAVVHGLYRLFAAPGGAAARLRGAGLNLTDRLAVVKNVLIREAMR
ncbi:MAG: FAD-dependent monooxygenase [Betaproteobacteria bacterium]